MGAALALVIGVGNEYRGDDGAGLVVARALRTLAPPYTDIVEHSGEATSLIDAWQDARYVVVVDAVRTGGTPGTIYRMEAHNTPVPARFLSQSTHDLGVAEAIELSRATGCLPERAIIYGIEGQDFAVGAALSPQVARASRTVAARVADELCQVAAHGDARS